MKAIVVREYGGPEVMRLEEAPTPVPGEGQVLVRMIGAGVNPADTYSRSGAYANKPPLPFTPGTDGAGLVHSVGPGVSLARPGDRVYVAGSLSGTYAEYALSLESRVHRLPERISFPRALASSCPTPRPTGRLCSWRALAPARGSSCTAPAAESESRPSSSPARRE